MPFSASIQGFLDDLAAGTAAPGGGAAAATSGAMGAALVCMVCNLTIGRRKYAAVDAEMRTILARAEALRADLAQLVSDDPAAFSAVMDAFRLPKATDEEQAVRRDAIQAGTRAATRTSLATARACAEVIALCQAAVASGNANAAGDAAAGAACAQAGLKAAALNVAVNLASIDDEDFAAVCRAELAEISLAVALADEVRAVVASQFRSGG